MERALAKQVRFGRSCPRCKAYFVADQEDARLCPWCEKVESGHLQAEAYDLDFR